MNREALIDKMAAAINDVGHINDNSRAKARRALAAIESAGLKIMGREPTEEMIDAGVNPGGKIVTVADRIAATFRAAWDAAPTYTDKEAQKCQK